MTKQQLIIVMGISGTGKSTVAQHIAQNLHYHYMEADNFHSAEAKEMMANNIALTEQQRLPWIKTMCEQLSHHQQQNRHVVLAYSGLKKHHRDMFRALKFRLNFLWLHGDNAVIATRMKNRENHFVDANFLTSQLADFETPLANETDVTLVDITMAKSQVLSNAMVIAKRLTQ